MFPSKVTPVKDSILLEMLIIKKTIEFEELSPKELFIKIQNQKRIDPSIFLMCLDILFAIGDIIINGGTMRIVKKDSF